MVEFFHYLLGAMLKKLAIFKEEHVFGGVHNFFNLTCNNMGGDVTQNDDFQKKKNGFSGVNNVFKRNYGSDFMK